MFNRFFKKRKLGRGLKFLLICNFIFAAGLLLSYLATHVNPVHWTWIALAGLLYPVFLLVNFVFIFFWSLLRNAWLLLSLSVFSLGINHFRHFYQITFSSGEALNADNIQLKIMSWNVRLFNYYDEDERMATRDAIFEVLKKEDPDIILFQEFYHTDRTGHFETKNELVKFLSANKYYEGYTHKLHHQQYFGLATFSRFPIVNAGTINFDNDPNNNVIYTDLKINSDTIRVYNSHLSSIRFQRGDYEFIGDTINSKKWLYKNQITEPEDQKIIARLRTAFVKRAEQCEQLLDHQKQSPYPVIIGGDFNDTPVSYFYRQMTEHLNDAFVSCGSGIGGTYIGKIPSFRIDYLFYDDHFHAYQFETRSEELSDHKAIQCYFELTK